MRIGNLPLRHVAAVRRVTLPEPAQPRAEIGLHEMESRIGEARAAMALVPVKSNVAAGTAIMGDAAEIYARAGDHDNAIGLLGQLLDMPAGREVSVPELRVDPRWDPLRADARVVRMVAGSARP